MAVRIQTPKTIKAFLLKMFKNNFSKKEKNKFEEVKRTRLIRKMRSNAIAIITNQISIHSGCIKMNYFIDRIGEIEPFKNMGLKVFKDFYEAFSVYPIENERQNYNKEFLVHLDIKLKVVDDKYKPQIIEKCKEIIEKFEVLTALNFLLLFITQKLLVF